MLGYVFNFKTYMKVLIVHMVQQLEATAGLKNI